VALKIELRGLKGAQAIPQELRRAASELKQEVGDGLVAAIRRRIRNRSGRLSASWMAHVTAGGRNASISSRHPGAKASVFGAWIVPKRKRALAYSSGAFSMHTRLNPGAYIGRPRDRKTSYITLAFAQFGAITKRAFGKAFGDLKRDG